MPEPTEAPRPDERAFLHTFGETPQEWIDGALVRIRGLREYGPGVGENHAAICARIEDCLTHLRDHFEPHGTHVILSRQIVEHLEREAGLFGA